MDIFQIIFEQLKGFDPLVSGFIVVVVIVFLLRYETKKDVKMMKEVIEKQEKNTNDTILGFMQEVNDSIKEERKMNYKMMHSIDKEIHDVLKQLGECIGELRGKKE